MLTYAYIFVGQHYLAKLGISLIQLKLCLQQIKTFGFRKLINLNQEYFALQSSNHTNISYKQIYSLVCNSHVNMELFPCN